MSTNILLVDSNPTSAPHLRINKEFKCIKISIDTSKFSSAFEIDYSNATTVEDLRRFLLESDPEILHFSAHGNLHEIFLENDDGSLNGVSHDSLLELLKVLENTKCIILNVCDSYQFGKKISEFVPYVICVNGKVLDTDAINFSSGFYDAIARGKTVKESFKLGLNAIRLHMNKDNAVLNRSLYRKKSNYLYNIFENKKIVGRSKGLKLLYLAVSAVTLYLILQSIFKFPQI